jgi:hypothetical protein
VEKILKKVKISIFGNKLNIKKIDISIAETLNNTPEKLLMIRQ